MDEIPEELIVLSALAFSFWLCGMAGAIAFAIGYVFERVMGELEDDEL